MFWRAFLLLLVVASASVALTMVFGAKVLLALGLILTQLKVIAQKVLSIELPSVLLWFKSQAALFFRFELIKKYILGTLTPMLIGSALKNRLVAVLSRYKLALKSRYMRMMLWYGGLEWYEQVIAALIVIFATLALSVSSIGLWVVLFSVKLPFMIAAGVGAFWRILWTTIAKMAFKTAAFFQLGWLWKRISRVLPESYLDRKRRWDFRVARAVVRSRRLTVRQLHAQKDSLSMRLALMAAYFRQPRPEFPEIGEEEISPPPSETDQHPTA